MQQAVIELNVLGQEMDEMKNNILSEPSVCKSGQCFSFMLQCFLSTNFTLEEDL